MDFIRTSKERYSYRRIYGLLRKEGTIVSEKIVRRIMKEEGLLAKIRKHAKYTSYSGEITPTVPNEIKRTEHPVIHTDRGCHYRWTG